MSDITVPKQSPVLSIITVVYNNVHSLEATILSVVNQSYKNIEYIIIDGGSQDGTLDIITKYAQKITDWVSEQDQGVYDAMNKGISRASGEWILFLGADDVLSDHHIIDSIFNSEEKQERKNSLSQYDLIVGNVKYKNGKFVNGQFNSLLKVRNTVHHQAAFYRRRLFDDFQYNSEFLISSDYELNIKLFLQKAAYLKIERVVAICDVHGLSSSCLHFGYWEEIKIRNKYLPLKTAIVYDFMTILRFVIKKILNNFIFIFKYAVGLIVSKSKY